MNKQRRMLIKEAEQLLNKVKNIIDDVLLEEESAFDNLSEGLQCTARGGEMEENIDILNDITDKLDDITDLINDIN